MNQVPQRFLSGYNILENSPDRDAELSSKERSFRPDMKQGHTEPTQNNFHEVSLLFIYSIMLPNILLQGGSYNVNLFPRSIVDSNILS